MKGKSIKEHATDWLEDFVMKENKKNYIEYQLKIVSKGALVKLYALLLVFLIFVSIICVLGDLRGLLTFLVCVSAPTLLSFIATVFSRFEKGKGLKQLIDELNEKRAIIRNRFHEC